MRSAEIEAEISRLADAVHEELETIRFPKQTSRSAVIIPLRVHLTPTRDVDGAAGMMGQGAKLLAGLGGAHENAGL
ncbi:hypothetical protein GCM10007919_50110 [Rhizobium indigoferae]|nr:hypothetical protein GCM10007919_50110 [Rhizobium indigoferae]